MYALTTYFNPNHYKSRLSNYRLFRQRLGIPLVTIELGFGSKFELKPHDADTLISIKGESILWQKERLLNIALGYVPANVENIAWLDCDIIFGRDDWVRKAVKMLESKPLIQAFSTAYRLRKNEIPTAEQFKPIGFPRKSSVSLLKNDSTGKKVLHHGSVGFAWAAKREVLEQHGFYDAMIIGGGDYAMACAAYGKFDEAIAAGQMNDRRVAHYLAWARPFHQHILGNVGYVESNIFHLWHGDIANRRYQERHLELKVTNFDPFTDIAHAPNGCWKIVGTNPILRTKLSDYFAARKEDD